MGNDNNVKDFSSITALNSTASKLPRKLTNEMIHARNLLKIFKETFQNEEVELDERLKEELGREDFEIFNRSGMLKTQICEHLALASELPPLITKPPIAPTSCQVVDSNSNVTAGEHHLSPTSQRKCPDSPFSINGRVEIFNSKSLHVSDNKMKLLPSTPPSSTPLATAKKSHLPYIVKASNNSSTTSNIEFPKQQKPTQSATALQTVTEATTSVKQQEKIDTKPMPAMRPTVVNEPQSECHIRTSEAIKQQPEVVVSTMSTKKNNSTLQGKLISPPKPLPRSSQISQPPVAAKRNLMPLNKSEALSMEEEKKPPLISTSSTSSTCSSDCTVIEAQQNTYLRSSTTSNNSAATSAMEASKIKSQVQIHGDESDEDKRKESGCLKYSKDVLSAEIPVLVSCSPNESSLYKLANSTPYSSSSPIVQTPTIPTSLVLNSAMCSTLVASLPITPALAKIQRQEIVGEETRKMLDVATQRLPYPEYVEVNREEIENSSVAIANFDTSRQPYIKEDFCQKVDIHTIPDSRQSSATTKFISVSPTEICKSDNSCRSVGSLPLKSLSKPNSPIIAARAAHSRALIETCEKIIAEEKLASSQLKSTLPSSSLQCNTPISQRKSKIPLPLTTCCKPAESITEADLQQNTSPRNPRKDDRDDNVVIARMHVVETQIKVTTTTPPTSPKPKIKSLSNSPQPQSQTQHSPRKTKNIFDFLKRNFGVGFQNTNEETTSAVPSTPEALQRTPNPLVLTNDDIVKYDEIHKIDNAKFYLPADDTPPPPLPDSPAPVNIEITKRFITDEIFEDGKTEMDLTMEINELLDDELNKLNEEIKELEKVEKTNN
ncbi:uncharacterized protein CG43427-like [Glossina fuscipes fuscipes]